MSSSINILNDEVVPGGITFIHHGEQILKLHERSGYLMPLRLRYGLPVVLCSKDRKIGSLDSRPRHVGLRQGFTLIEGIKSI